MNVMDYNVSGSSYAASGFIKAGSHEIAVNDVGDFMPGQGVIVRGGSISYPDTVLWRGTSSRVPIKDEIQIRGYNGTGKDGWVVYMLDIDGTSPLTFRWSDDMGRSWKGAKVAVTHGWQKLSYGVEIRFSERSWHLGEVISFHARDSLFTEIEAIGKNSITLKQAPDRSSDNAVILHDDTVAIQSAIDSAIHEKKNLFFPTGHYRLKGPLNVLNVNGIEILGSDGQNTILDISQGTGACFFLKKGNEVTIKNFKMIGHTGAGDMAPSVRTSGGYYLWVIGFKPCRAIGISGTKQVHIENVHASKMSVECFYSQGPGREGDKEPEYYTKSITYLRCSVSDCVFNAFNTNDMSENINILYCRVENIGNCFWEGGGRFVRITGNYVKNAGVCVIGNMFHRYDHLKDLGMGQTVVSDNTFEGISRNDAGIRVTHAASQVVIKNNLFVNYGSTAIQLSARDKAEFSRPTKDTSFKSSFPPRNVLVTGNIIDLTYRGEKQSVRDGIDIGLSYADVSDNQIYVRVNDKKTVGIRLRESALNVIVHDNLIDNCGTGIITQHVSAEVGETTSNTSFLRKGADMPLEWPDSHRYQGWYLAWLKDGKVTDISQIDQWDPETLQFHLKEPHPMKVGDSFHFFPPQSAWNIHDNIVSGSTVPLILDCYGSETSVFRGNTILRGTIKGVQTAARVKGCFTFIGNQFVGFDEKGAVTLELERQSVNRPCFSVFRNNIFENCTRAVHANPPELWKDKDRESNIFNSCTVGE